jgi:hypothetical protein
MLSVGNALQWHDSITTLTDSSRGSYRRICVIDDRLVGYLSLGPVQPDSLAIKRIIDEGLPIGDIKKELLRGTFDARKYFSRQRTFAAQHMITTGRIPFDVMPRPLTTKKLGSPEGAAEESSPQPGIPTAPGVSALRPAAFEQTAALAGPEAQLAGLLPSTGPLATPAAAAVNRMAGPTVPRNIRDTGELQLFAHPFMPTPVNVVKFQHRTDFMAGIGNGSASDRGTSPVVESKLAGLPSVSPSSMSPAQRAPKRQFKAPPVTKPRKRQNGQFGRLIERERDQQAEKQDKLSARYPSSSLWSYSDKIPVMKKGH